MGDPPAKPTRVAVYARVSTSDKGQDPENQLAQLREHCRQQGWTWTEYIDRESGTRADRPEFNRLLADAEAGRLDLVLCWKLDRFTRAPMKEALGFLQRLDKAGVRFKSFTEPFLSEDVRLSDLLLGLFSWMANQEVVRMRERIKAGLDRAKANGKVLGRRPKHGDRAAEVRARILKLRAEGRSLRDISAAVGLSRSRVSQILKAAQPPIAPLPDPKPHPTMPGFFTA